MSPMAGLVVALHVDAGDEVKAGQPLAVIEAMKMLHTLTAGGPGVVAEVRVRPGDQVETNQILVTFEEDDPDA